MGDSHTIIFNFSKFQFSFNNFLFSLFQHRVIMADYAYGVPLNHTFLPEKLKALGYDTHIIGK